jgi:hypothetical protein
VPPAVPGVICKLRFDSNPCTEEFGAARHDTCHAIGKFVQKAQQIELNIEVILLGQPSYV